LQVNQKQQTGVNSSRYRVGVLSQSMDCNLVNKSGKKYHTVEAVPQSNRNVR